MLVVVYYGMCKAGQTPVYKMLVACVLIWLLRWPGDIWRYIKIRDNMPWTTFRKVAENKAVPNGVFNFQMIY